MNFSRLTTLFLVNAAVIQAEETAPDYSVVSDSAQPDASNEQVNVNTTFGGSSYGAKTELLDSACDSAVGDVLTLVTSNHTIFQPSDSRVITSTIQVSPEHLNDSGNELVVFALDNFPTSVKGAIKFCLKSHSTAQVDATEIRMEVLKTRYEIQYDGEDAVFALENTIAATDIDIGDTFQNGEVLTSTTISAVRCLPTSTADTGLTSTMIEGDSFYLCIAPVNDGSSDFELSDINLKAEYGQLFGNSLELVSNGTAILSFVTVELDPDGNGWTRFTVPILSEFMETGNQMKLSGDADVAFKQLRLDGENEDEINSSFEFTIDLEDKTKKGCFGRLFDEMNKIFF